MKALRTRIGRHVYRSLFAFDLERQAFIFVGGEKSGKKGKTLYRRLIARTDSIFERQLQEQRKGIQGGKNTIIKCYFKVNNEGKIMHSLDRVMKKAFTPGKRAEIRRKAKEKVAAIRLRHLRETRHVT